MVSSHVWWWESQAWGTCSGLLGGSWGSCLLSHRWQGSVPCFFFSPPYSSSPSLSTFSNSVQRKYQTDPLRLAWLSSPNTALLSLFRKLEFNKDESKFHCLWKGLLTNTVQCAAPWGEMEKMSFGGLTLRHHRNHRTICWRVNHHYHHLVHDNHHIISHTYQVSQSTSFSVYDQAENTTKIL